MLCDEAQSDIERSEEFESSDGEGITRRDFNICRKMWGGLWDKRYASDVDGDGRVVGMLTPIQLRSFLMSANLTVELLTRVIKDINAIISAGDGVCLHKRSVYLTLDSAFKALRLKRKCDGTSNVVLRFECLHASVVMHRVLSECRSAIFCSGTIVDTDSFCAEMGIDNADVISTGHVVSSAQLHVRVVDAPNFKFEYGVFQELARFKSNEYEDLPWDKMSNLKCFITQLILSSHPFTKESLSDMRTAMEQDMPTSALIPFSPGEISIFAITKHMATPNLQLITGGTLTAPPHPTMAILNYGKGQLDKKRIFVRCKHCQRSIGHMHHSKWRSRWTEDDFKCTCPRFLACPVISVITPRDRYSLVICGNDYILHESLSLTYDQICAEFASLTLPPQAHVEVPVVVAHTPEAEFIPLEDDFGTGGPSETSDSSFIAPTHSQLISSFSQELPEVSAIDRYVHSDSY
ncbi:hypothetical protein ADUPG1_013915 [Aduncisulcus paluster]|uniref:Uncharacterized protein n=1 Tax=Aduncisulcus paluster TaxID=2918883 RepID=A0ABQ5K8U5_9EUKA|nr:hypothetical protein ADUPG1_013915 [Aduncisulcus paluster]